jgi:hypothetical protein
MADTQIPTDREPVHGQKMIEVRLRFWTNNIAEQGRIRPRHAWSSGVVLVERNESHGIVPGNPLPFHSLLDVGSVIEAAFIEHGIVLHPSPEMAKYFDTTPGSVVGVAAKRSEAAKKANAIRGAAGRSDAAKKANVTRGVAGRSNAAKKANKTRREAQGDKTLKK